MAKQPTGRYIEQDDGSFKKEMQEVERTVKQTTRSLTDLVNTMAVAAGPLAALRAGIAAIQNQVVSFVEKANPAAVQKFTFAVQDLQGVIGRALTPLLVNLTAVMQKLADYFYALQPAAKTLFAGLVAAGIGFTVVTVAVIGLNAAFATLTGGLSTILGAVGALIAGVLVASSGTDALRSALDTVMGPLSQVINAIGEIAGALISAVVPIIQTIFDVIMLGFRALLPIINVTVVVLQKMAAVFRAIFEFVAEILGIQLAAGRAPGKAPSAVRPAEIGGLNEFLNKQLVTALSGGAGKSPELKIGEGIAADVKECKQWLEKIFGKAQEVPGRAVAGAAQAIQFLPNLAGALIDRVVGK